MSNKITITTKPVGPDIYLIQLAGCGLEYGLKAKDFVPFDPNLEFAGVSVQGKLLSVPNKPETANISGYPIRLCNTENEPLQISYKGVLVNKKNPSIYAGLLRKFRWDPNLFIENSSDLLERTDFFESSSGPTDWITIDKDLPTVIWFYTHFPETRIGYNKSSFSIRIPKTQKFSADNWQKLARHAYLNAEASTYEETIKLFDSDTGSYFWFPGTSFAALKTTCGITGTPTAFSGKSFGFQRFFAEDPAKASQVYPFIKNFGRKHYAFDPSYGINDTFVLDDVILNPTIWEPDDTIRLHDITSFRSKHSDVSRLKLTHPLRLSANYHSITEVICPLEILDNHLFPAAKACKTHNLKAVKKYSVRLPAITTHESYSNTKLLPGTYVFLKDLSNLEKRDAKAEFSNRKSRKATLEATYGPLPAGLTGLKDDEIAKYFTVKKEVELGHFVPLQDRCELFPIYSKRFIFISWLKSIGSILECPLTKTEYIKDYKTMDDLAELPGFIKTLLSYLENKAFSLQILSSRKVHQQAIAELI